MKRSFLIGTSWFESVFFSFTVTGFYFNINLGLV